MACVCVVFCCGRVCSFWCLVHVCFVCELLRDVVCLALVWDLCLWFVSCVCVSSL